MIKFKTGSLKFDKFIKFQIKDDKDLVDVYSLHLVDVYSLHYVSKICY